MLIAADKVVSIDYTLTNDEGEVIDSSGPGDPLVYLHGADNIVTGLEGALAGKTAGDELNIVVEPEEGYGDYHPELVSVVDRAAFEGIDEIEAGMEFEAQSPDGDSQIITVREVDGDEITVDGNHPLAGQRLTFQVKVVDIRDATEDELAHGHPHDGEDGHHH